MVTPADIQAGLDRGEFFLEYQPIVSLADGRCTGCEALLRWRRLGRMIGPGEFIPVAEESALGGLLTYFAIETAARELGPWLAERPQLFMSINVPPALLGRGGIAYAAQKTGYYRVLREQLILEITERGIPDSMGMAEMQAAARNGVRFALDDVTLDSANLAILSRCTFHVIKIDRQRVAEIDGARPLPEWLAGLSALLSATDLQVIAEGVETPAQEQVLRAAGIPLAQGSLYSRPLAARALQAFQAWNGDAPADAGTAPLAGPG
ncbi:EAL domain-containing protein [Pseudoxanthomonas sp. 10H]|uniref:EAL domain-containing protein n=1 Tax=Pseudoxanthomonas sp. 10H TaxID=3242729 RepID=UPI003557B67F